MSSLYNDDPFANPGEPKRGQCVLHRNVWFKPEDFPVDEIVDELKAFGVNQSALETICTRMKAKSLFIKGMTATDLMPFADLDVLDKLHILWANKFSDASPIARMKNLRRLCIIDTMRWHDLGQLSGSRVSHLEISGGMNRSGLYESLAPLSSLTKLTHLQMMHFRLNRNGLKPLKDCQQLESLSVDCSFPTEDYAYLSVNLPHVDCDAFAPFIRLRGNHIGEKDVMIIGHRKPFLNSKKDAKRLANYVKAFEELQEKFRTEL